MSLKKIRQTFIFSLLAVMVGNLESQTVEGISGEIIPIPITKNISNDKFIIKNQNGLFKLVSLPFVRQDLLITRHEIDVKVKWVNFGESKITIKDDSKVNLCDMHKIDGKRSKDYVVGNKINNKTIKDIKWYGGVERSYDLLTSHDLSIEDTGYRISGVPVNSMIEELAQIMNLLKETV